MLIRKIDELDNRDFNIRSVYVTLYLVFVNLLEQREREREREGFSLEDPALKQIWNGHESKKIRIVVTSKIHLQGRTPLDFLPFHPTCDLTFHANVIRSDSEQKEVFSC
jgi:hypothetical protein